MARDTDKVKSTDEKLNKKSSKRVSPIGEKLEVSRDEPRTDYFLEVSQNPWLNLTLRYLTSVVAVIIALWLYFFITSLLGPGLPTYILFYPGCNNSCSSSGFWTRFTGHHPFHTAGGNLDSTTTGRTFNHINCGSGWSSTFHRFWNTYEWCVRNLSEKSD